MKARTGTLAVSLVALATMALGACGSDKDTKATTTAAPTTAAVTTAAPTTAAPPTTETHPTTTKPKATTTTDGGGGHAQAGAPQWETFEATSPVACKAGNATVTMKWTTLNVVSVAIKIGDGKFESTAGYNPNETAAVASIPCTGAGQSSITLRGCTENNTCADSPTRDITITA